MAKKSLSENGCPDAWVPEPARGKTATRDWLERLNKRLERRDAGGESSILVHRYVLETRGGVRGAMLAYPEIIPYSEDCGSEPSGWIEDLNRELEEREKTIVRPPFTRKPWKYLFNKIKRRAELSYKQNGPGGRTDPSRWMQTPVKGTVSVRPGAFEEAEALGGNAGRAEPDTATLEGMADRRHA